MANGYFILLFAGNVGIYKVLLEFDADPWSVNESGETPLVKAIKSARIKVTKLIDLVQALVSKLSGKFHIKGHLKVTVSLVQIC